MKRAKTPTFVLTRPLAVSPTDDRTLIGRLEAGRRLYNATLGEALRRPGLLKQSKAWQAARTLSTPKQRSTEFQRLAEEFKFTPASLITFARARKNAAGWTDRLGSNVAQRLAEHAFAATQEYSFGKRGRPRFKGKNRPLHSLEATTNQANLIWKPETGGLEMGTLTLPARLPTPAQDPYVHEALASRTKFCRILWRRVNGKRRWFVQLMQEGLPPLQSFVAKGEVVGIDLGPSTVAIVGEESASLVKLCATVEQPWKKLKSLQKKMDRSRRKTNPQCYQTHGVWKSGKHKFVPSKRYLKLKAKKAEIERKLVAERKRSHGELANSILKLGNIIQAEKLSLRSFQKNFGKSVQIRAPGMLIDTLRRKAESAGGQFVDLKTGKLKMLQYDHMTQTYFKKPLALRWHTLGDGSGVVQRDIYSAFLARCVLNQTHHPFHLQARWTAQKPVLLQTRWLRSQPTTIQPSGRMTESLPFELVVCNRGLKTGHGRDAVVVRREPGDPCAVLPLEPPGFSQGEV